MKKLLLLVLTSSLLAACGSLTPASPSEPLPSPTSAWTVKMEHSGGIMGMLRAIVASSDGSFTVTDERASKEVSGQLPADELTELSRLVNDARRASPQKSDMLCADCFIYDIEISATGKPFQAHVDDLTLPGSGLELLVAFLRDVMDRALN